MVEAETTAEEWNLASKSGEEETSKNATDNSLFGFQMASGRIKLTKRSPKKGLHISSVDESRETTLVGALFQSWCGVADICTRYYN